MVDEKIDTGTMESMKRFSEFSEKSRNNMRSLREEIQEFNKVMNAAHSTTDSLRESLRQMSNVQPAQPITEALEAERTTATTNARIANAPTPAQSQAAEPVGMSQNVTINTLRIDVSGVTDRSDKRALAREISEMVTKELRAKMGGPLSTSGLNRGV
jgi:hypothetical protein